MRGEGGADLHRGRRDLPAIPAGGGEEAAEEDLSARAAEDLVVRRDRDDVAARIRAELNGRRRLDRALEELLGDAAHAPELRVEVVPRLPADRELELRKLLADCARVRRAFRIPEDRVAFAREAVVQLDDGLPERGVAALEVDEGRFEVRVVPQVLVAFRARDACLAEDPTASRFRPEVDERRIDAVQRNPEKDGKPPLERSRVEDREVGPRAVGDPRADALDEARTLEDLLREGARRCVVRAEERQAAARVARGDADEELEVVLEDEGVDGLRRHEHDPCARIAQPDQEKEEALLVEARPVQLHQLGLVERQGGNDDRRVGLLVASRDRVPDLQKPGFQLLELCELAFERKVGRERRPRDHWPGILGSRPELRHGSCLRAAGNSEKGRD